MRGYPRRAERMTELARLRLDADLRRDWPNEPDEKLVRRLRGHHDEAVEFRVPHVLASVISAPLFQNVTESVRRLVPDGADSLVLEAVCGLGGIHLREAAGAMVEVAGGRLSREAFVDTYGFRGANEFELAALPWRDDPATLDRLIEAAATERPDLATGRRDGARARLRTAAGWSNGVWSTNAAVNYANGYTDTNVLPFGHIAAYTTVDLNAGWRIPASPGTIISLSLVNAFDAGPPRTAPSINRLAYDPSNADPRGRALSWR